MESTTQRLNDNPFAETGTVVFEGQSFSNLGAVEHDNLLYCYDSEKTGTVTSWDGSTSFGRIISRRQYRAGFSDMTGRPSRMVALKVRRPDGTQWNGRYGYDGGSLVKLRPAT